METFLDIVRFAFILVVPIVLAGGAALSLFALGAVIYVFEHPGELRKLIEGAFRKPEKPSRQPSSSHYYQPYWTRRSSGDSG